MTRSATPGEPDREVDEHIARGEVSTYDNVEDFLASLPTPGEPETEAGRLLLMEWNGDDGYAIDIERRILAIEAEARAESSAEMERLRAAALTELDVIDSIVDDTHPEGDGCPLCVALDDLRAALGDSR